MTSHLVHSGDVGAGVREVGDKGAAEIVWGQVVGASQPGPFLKHSVDCLIGQLFAAVPAVQPQNIGPFCLP